MALPVFHAGYFKATIAILQQICKSCSGILLEESQRRSFLKRLQAPLLENPVKMKILKQVNEACRKRTDCPHCGATNGNVKKVGICKIIHEKFKAKSKVDELETFRQDFDNLILHAPETKAHVNKALEDLNPVRVLELFKAISALVRGLVHSRWTKFLLLGLRGHGPGSREWTSQTIYLDQGASAASVYSAVGGHGSW